MKAQTLTNEQVLSRMSEFYHEDFQQLAKSMLQSDENIIWAGNQSEVLYYGSSGYLGYFLITSYRAIRVNFAVEFGLFGGREKIKVGKDSSGHDDFRAVSLPSQPLTTKEKQRRYGSEALLRNISRVERTDFKIRRQDKDTTLVELYVHLSPEGALGSGPMTFYSLQDGQEAYEILQRAMRGETTETQGNLVDKLERLATLRKSGDLSDVEFEKAKQQLLGG